MHEVNELALGKELRSLKHDDSRLNRVLVSKPQPGPMNLYVTNDLQTRRSEGIPKPNN
jgi:hypothetical protein